MYVLKIFVPGSIKLVNYPLINTFIFQINYISMASSCKYSISAAPEAGQSVYFFSITTMLHILDIT